MTDDLTETLQSDLRVLDELIEYHRHELEQCIRDHERKRLELGNISKKRRQ